MKMKTKMNNKKKCNKYKWNRNKWGNKERKFLYLYSIFLLIFIVIDIFELSKFVYKDSLNCDEENGCTYIQHTILSKDNEFKFNRENILSFSTERKSEKGALFRPTRFPYLMFKNIYMVVLYKYGKIQISQEISYKLQLFKEGNVKEIEYHSFRIEEDEISFTCELLFITLIIFLMFLLEVSLLKEKYMKYMAYKKYKMQKHMAYKKFKKQKYIVYKKYKKERKYHNNKKYLSNDEFKE